MSVEVDAAIVEVYTYIQRKIQWYWFGEDVPFA